MPQYMQIFFGGSSSGKSYFLAQKIVLDNMDGANWLVCRNVAKTLRKSVFNEVKKAIIKAGLLQWYKINTSEMVITNKLNGKQILFAGLDDPEKIKSVSPEVGVIERVFVEEATEVKRDAIKQLKKRLRGRSKISKHIYLAFNPILKSHYLYKEYFKNWIDGQNVYKDKDLLIVKTTYKDNLYLTPEDIEQLENEDDKYFYEVYTLGNWGILGNVIFKNWRVEDLSSVTASFDHVCNGLDFGYSVDPNALLKCHLDKKRKKIYVFKEGGAAGMSDDELADLCFDMCNHEYISCDEAEPRTIDYLSSRGLNAIPCIKGADSIRRGIRWLQGYEIIIDVRCQNFKNEIEQYHWKQDKDGNVMNVPVDKNNHWLDALRYALCDEILGSAEVVAGKRI
ncbi:MAG: PBSX family phage terminase large subunit [Ruminococcus sp.]|uniref:PBSX family phage terminase large subunit n=1 Tax=Ruminococcus sp. TaxID=41978 RepID=UPI002873642B|nr:PBSX family phage terminase large subunit [Ruminococcus sp.]MBQ3285403.1 PBSX family phage terminase large subunit [Ruminococcus sp.]